MYIKQFNSLKYKPLNFNHVMKKLLFTSILLALFTNVGLAQNNKSKVPDIASVSDLLQNNESRFIINVHTGYAFGMGTTFKYYPDDITSIRMEQVANAATTKSVTYSSPTKGLGQGFRVGAGVSYILNDFINIGLDVDYFKSTISKTKDSSYSQSNVPGGISGMDSYDYNERYKTSYTATLLTFSPNITFKAITKPKWYLYNKLGAVMTFGPKSTQRDSKITNERIGWQGLVRETSTANAKTYDWGIKNPAFGFMGGIGAQFKLSNKLRVFGELQFSHVVFVVRTKTLTNFTVDGVDMLNSLPLSQRQVQFSSSFTVNQTNEPNAPARATTENIPITYMGFQSGFAYRF